METPKPLVLNPRAKNYYHRAAPDKHSHFQHTFQVSWTVSSYSLCNLHESASPSRGPALPFSRYFIRFRKKKVSKMRYDEDYCSLSWYKVKCYRYGSLLLYLKSGESTCSFLKHWFQFTLRFSLSQYTHTGAVHTRLIQVLVYETWHLSYFLLHRSPVRIKNFSS